MSKNPVFCFPTALLPSLRNRHRTDPQKKNTGIRDMANCIRCVRRSCPSSCLVLDPYDHIFLGTISGDFFIPAFQCPHRVERIGTLGDGGKWVCGIDRVAKQEQCVVYSFGPFLLSFGCLSPPLTLPPGINNDSSFESSLLRRAPTCEIWGYDFSVKSVRLFSNFRGFFFAPYQGFSRI